LTITNDNQPCFDFSCDMVGEEPDMLGNIVKPSTASLGLGIQSIIQDGVIHSTMPPDVFIGSSCCVM
jgi:hypothetical protein